MTTRRPKPSYPTSGTDANKPFLEWLDRQFSDALGSTYASLLALVNSLRAATAAVQTNVDALEVVDVETISGTTHTVSAADVLKYHRCTNGSNVTITLNTSHGFAVGESAIYFGATSGTGQITFSPTGVTVTSEDSVLTLRPKCGGLLICTGATSFDLVGGLDV